jgi:hypothetical protein
MMKAVVKGMHLFATGFHPTDLHVILITLTTEVINTCLSKKKDRRSRATPHCHRTLIPSGLKLCRSVHPMSAAPPERMIENL